MALKRRSFLATTAASAIAASTTNAFAANDRIGLALIGCGGRGNDRLRECMTKQRHLGFDLVALCDVWTKNLDATADVVERATDTRPATYQRYADVLERDDIDAVIIATPDFAHCPIGIDAANAGKHIYIEKPMASNMDDANSIVDAVEANGVVCQVGTQRRSDGRHMAAARAMQDGLLGQLVKCDSGWHDNGPRWRRGFDDVRAEDVDWEQYLMGLPSRDFDPRFFRCWHLYRECSVGLSGLLGSHLIDVATWYADDPYPETAVGMGGKIVWKERENLDTQECLFRYPKGFLLQYSSRLGNSNSGPENIFYGTNGTFDTDSWTARGEGGGEERLAEPIEIEPERSRGHMANWFACMHDGNVQTNATVRDGHAHSVASIMGSLACDTGRTMAYDPETRSIREA